MKPNQQTTEVVSTPGEVFDVPKVRRFVQLMKDFDLCEMELQQGDMHIVLKRGTMVAAVPTVMNSAPVSASEVSANAAPVLPEPPKEDKSYLKNITSPIVGTFYSKPGPTSPAFVNVGDSVADGKTVCIIEAMKVMNQIPSTLSGKIAAVLVNDGDAVEFGQPLFSVDTRG